MMGYVDARNFSILILKGSLGQFSDAREFWGVFFVIERGRFRSGNRLVKSRGIFLWSR